MEPRAGLGHDFTSKNVRYIAITRMAGPVGYAHYSERILTFSSSMGIQFYSPHTHVPGARAVNIGC